MPSPAALSACIVCSGSTSFTGKQPARNLRSDRCGYSHPCGNPPDTPPVTSGRIAAAFRIPAAITPDKPPVTPFRPNDAILGCNAALCCLLEQQQSGSTGFTGKQPTRNRMPLPYSLKHSPAPAGRFPIPPIPLKEG